MREAFQTWDTPEESLESVEERIHDGAPRAKLHERAAEYARHILAVPWLALRPTDAVVEIGSGVGYIMQAVAEAAGLQRITGLDVAMGMIAHAEERIRRDRLSSERYRFQHYDGVHMPWEDGTVDLFYSVAAIQHIPKPFAYNLFLEANRCLRPGGTAFLHLLGWGFVSQQYLSFAEEIRNQVSGATTHWHHYYDREELEALFTHALGSPRRILMEDGVSIWVAWQK